MAEVIAMTKAQHTFSAELGRFVINRVQHHKLSMVEALAILHMRTELVHVQINNALAPELRTINPAHVHRISDYSGATREERLERIAQIINIAKEHDYNAIFAGYGFMAEDEEFVRAIEGAGLVSPAGARAAGRKCVLFSAAMR